MSKDTKDGLSPMMKHYNSLKQQYIDCIILYRLGDFYEMFQDDALLASRILNLTLTSRKCGNGQKAHMCGVPAKSVDVYIKKLIEDGQKVAVCEQLSEPKAGEIVVRDIVRVITPGTVIESTLLDASNHYLAVVFKENTTLGVSFLDISTGEFYTSQFEEDIITNLNNLFSKIQPKEVIANDDADGMEEELTTVKSGAVPKFLYCLDDEYSYEDCKEMVKKQLNIKSLKEINCSNKKASIMSAGILLSYVKSTQKRDLTHINNLQYLNMNEYMEIDANSRRNLELTQNTKDGSKKGTLLYILDKTKTNMGKRTIKSFVDSPLLSESKINYRLQGVESLVKNIVYREQIKECLSDISDIERLTARISYNNITPKDCLQLAQSLNILPQVKNILSKLPSNIILDINEKLHDFSFIADKLLKAIKLDCPNNIKEGNFINKGYNAELDEILALKENSTDILSKLEVAEKEQTGIKNLKVGYNRVFGYYIEVPKSHVEFVPFRFIRKQTLANAERFITEELKTLEDRILNATERKLELEIELFKELREELLTYVTTMQESARAIGLLDTLTSLATVAVENNYVKPIIAKNNNNLEIIDGRHPVVESAKDCYFIPNDTILNNSDSRTMLITGPNMAGKSTYMRQVALINILAQIGSYVPAKSAKIAVVDRIFTRIGASDDLMMGQSTFMVEMSEVSNILKYATNNSLIILDEIGRGTSTFDGLSIAWAVMEYIAKNFYCKTLFSTHFHELTDLEGILEGVKNYKVLVKQQDNRIIFLRKIARGSVNQSFGIEVAALADLPQDVLDRSKEILHSLEQNDLNKDLVANIQREESMDNSQAKYRKALNEIGGILKDLDLNKMTPLGAFDLVLQLKETIDK